MAVEMDPQSYSIWIFGFMVLMFLGALIIFVWAKENEKK